MWKEFAKDIDKVEEQHAKKIDKKEDRVKKFRQEVSRKAAIANKRLKRLEEAGMTTSPAYEKWQESGGQYFSVRGKTFNEVQSEMARVNSYLDNATSSISGAKRVVKEMVANTGADFQWSDWQDLKQKTKVFFEIASKVEQYLRTVEDRASSIGYQKIWNAINEYVKKTEQSLDVTANEIDRISSDVVQAMKTWDDEIKTETTGYSIWTKLPKF